MHCNEKSWKSYIITYENHENYENHEIPFEHQTIFGDHRTPRENYKKMKILELYTIINRNHSISWENNANHETPIIQSENYENPRNLRENYENHENHRIPLRINNFIKDKEFH